MPKRLKTFGTALPPIMAKPTAQTVSYDVTVLPVTLIVPGRYQPRSELDNATLADLADTIRADGLIQPIVVRPIGGGRYELVAGERRWRACGLAGLDEIPAIIRELDDQQAATQALIENLQRENLNPIDEGRALKRLVDEFAMTHQEVAAAVGRSRVAVSNLIRLLDLEQNVQKMLIVGRLEMGHGRALLSLAGPGQVDVAKWAAEGRWSVRKTELAVRIYSLDLEPGVKKMVVDGQLEMDHAQALKSLDGVGQVEVAKRAAEGGWSVRKTERMVRTHGEDSNVQASVTPPADLHLLPVSWRERVRVIRTTRFGTELRLSQLTDAELEAILDSLATLDHERPE